MRTKTIVKEVEAALDLLLKGTREDYRKAIDKLIGLRGRLKLKLEEEEKKKGDGKKLQHLMGWYMNLWEGKPPERLRFMNADKIIGKHLKELIAIYEQNGEDIETLKRDYENFKRTWKTGDKGIMHFRSALPQIKQKDKGFYISPESRRGVDYYLKQLREEEVFDEGDELPW